MRTEIELDKSGTIVCCDCVGCIGVVVLVRPDCHGDGGVVGSGYRKLGWIHAHHHSVQPYSMKKLIVVEYHIL
jgi:hypothetical protein